MESLDWYVSFKNRLANQDVVILSGNIYDRYPLAGRLLRLNDVLRHLSWEALMPTQQGGAASLLGDGPAQAGTPPRLPAQSNDTELFQDLSLAMPSGGNALRGTAENAVIDEFVRRTGQAGPRRCYYFDNFSSNFPRTGNWEDQDWTRHYRLIAGVTAAAAAGSKTIFAFPSEAWIPAQFLQSFPSVCRFHIPWPTAQERRAWFADILNTAGIAPSSTLANRAAGLTDSLSWVELGQLRGHVVEAAQRTGEIDGAIRLFRYGIVKDYWKGLREDDRLRNAKDWIATASNEPVLDQDAAVKKSVRVLAKASYDVSAAISPDYRRPRGVLFFVGPTGVGKTMLAKKLAELIFGSSESCIVLDMSEYNVEHAEARLVGAPPGYVGYSEGGQLTSAIRQKPFSVVLFDEIDKAHPAIFKKFLQILDEGRLTDGKGQVCDFSQSLIIFTSNQCSDLEEFQPGPPPKPARNAPVEELVEYYQKALGAISPFDRNPEILNRIGLANIVPFRHIANEHSARRLIDGLIEKAKAFFQDRHGIKVSFVNREGLAEVVLKSKGCDFAKMGLRNVKQQFEATILELIAQAALQQDPDAPERRLYVWPQPGGGVSVGTRAPRETA